MHPLSTTHIEPNRDACTTLKQQSVWLMYVVPPNVTLQRVALVSVVLRLSL